MSGKTTIAQSIALTMNGAKDFTPGMIMRGEEKAEVITLTDDGLKIRTVLTDTAKQSVQRYDETLRRYTDVSGGVRTFLTSISSGLEMPWALRDTPDAKIIELLKNRCGIEAQIAAIDSEIKNKEALRTEVGRDKKKMGDPAVREPKVEDRTKQPEPIDGIKEERTKAINQINQRKALFSEYTENLRKKCFFNSLEQIDEYQTSVSAARKDVECLLEALISKYGIEYKQEDIDAFDKQLEKWVELKQKAGIYEKYLSEKEEWDRLTAQYDSLTQEIEDLRAQRKTVLAGMELGVKGLEIGEDNCLYHNGAVRGITETQKSGNWSTAESVQVFFGLGARFSGELKVLCVDNAESLDKKTTEAITSWAEKAGFLVILLRVAEVPENLEDGIIYVKEGEVLTK